MTRSNRATAGSGAELEGLLGAAGATAVTAAAAAAAAEAFDRWQCQALIT